MIRPGSGMGGSGRKRPGASDFDGTNDYALRGGDLTGVSDGKEGTFVFFVSPDADGVEYAIYEHASSRVLIRRDTANSLDLILRNAAGTIICRRITSNTILAAGGWQPILMSWDLANTTVQVYFGDTAATFGTSTPTTNDTIDYTAGNVSIGARASGAGDKLDGCLAGVWFAPDFIDFSVAANRRTFITADGHPKWIGSNGQTPTGAVPAIYMPTGDPADNRGYGGNFTVTGTLTACSDAP